MYVCMYVCNVLCSPRCLLMNDDSTTLYMIDSDPFYMDKSGLNPD